jgi:hypothetical protein
MIIYNVSIAAFNVGTSDATKLGFVDTTTVPQYLAQAAQPANFTLAQSQAKYRGNLRWKYILQSMALMANPYVSNMTATGAAINADATTFSFDVYFERDSAVTTVDNNNNVLNGSAAVQWVVAQALANTYTDNVEYYNPTLTTSYQNGAATQPFDYNDQNVGALITGPLAADVPTAAANITVTVVA